MHCKLYIIKIELKLNFNDIQFVMMASLVCVTTDEKQ